MTVNDEKNILDDMIIKGIQSLPEAEPPEGFSSRVMAGLEPKNPSVWTRFCLWLIEPRSVTFTPVRMASVLATAMVLLAIGFFALDGFESNEGVRLSTVRFVLKDAGMNARSVAVIGSFNGWDREDAVMHFDQDAGTWVLETRLPSGDHEYMFLVDGQKLMPDPKAQMTRDDGFGNRNSIVFVNGYHEQTL